MATESPTDRRNARLLTTDEVAAWLGICERTVRRLAERGELRRVDLGHRMARFDAEDVEALIRRKTSEGPAGNGTSAKLAGLATGHVRD